MTKTTITFWSGLQTIGGNIAEIRYQSDRVLFDFGLVYNPSNTLLKQDNNRKDSYVLDLLKLGSIPAIDGIYQKQDLQGNNWSITKPAAYASEDLNTAIFISHLHLDHIGAIDTIAPEIPVYLSAQATELYDALQVIGEGLPRGRHIKSINYQKSITIGEITVTSYQTDHDVYGAMALLIETPDLTVLYSGDIRMHGEHPEHNHYWLSQMKQKEIDLFLIEGTAFRPENTSKEEPVSIAHTEATIAVTVSNQLKNHDGLALFNIYHRNIDRIKQFIQAAQLSDRILVLEPETAYLADRFIPSPDIAILVTNEMQMLDWHSDLFAHYPLVTTKQINAQPDRFLIQNSFDQIMQLLDFNLADSIYYHANGIPLGSFDPNYFVLRELLAYFQIDYQSVNVSGHATQADILEIIDQINAQLVIPWHSHYPELVQPLSSTQAIFLPEKDIRYTFSHNQLVKTDT